MDPQEQLCQLEQQKPKIQQLYLEVYKNSIFNSLGPKISQGAFKCQPKEFNNQQQTNVQEDSYLNIQESYNPSQIQNIPKTSHSQQPSQNSQLVTEHQFIQITEEPKKFKRIINCSYLRKSSVIRHSDSSISEPPIQPIDLKECLICFADKSKTQFLAPLQCQHEFCKECLKDHLTQNIKRGNVLHINCPQQDCIQEYQEEQIRDLVSLKNFEKYKKFYHRQLISQNKNVRWCPKPDCENYAIGNGQDLLICQCGQEICFQCGNRYHLGQSCLQAEDAQYIQARKENQIHDCPNCKSPIQKKGGCNHMTCYKCKYQFCWVCKGKYSSYHYVIFNVFGCVVPGGQSANLQPFKNPMFLRIMMILPKIILTLLFITGLLIVFPFFLLYFIISAPYQIIKRSCGFRFSRYHKCVQLGYGIIYFFIGVLLSPLTILISPCWLLYLLIDNL